MVARQLESAADRLPRARVVATAGHVDHGKSSLVRALTGTDPDRLAEEKERGLTIDLGFASLVLPAGTPLSFIDVPGHVRFLKNMVAGVGAVDGCLFVVAATEGWKRQSEEHLRVLELLGVRRGVVALTKARPAGGELTAQRRDELGRHLAGTFLAGAPVAEVDSLEARGLERLTVLLDEMVATAPPAVDAGRPRLFVDRAFSARGAGAVVTGTLTGGGLTVGDELQVVPGPPPSWRTLVTRVRGLQVQGRARHEAAPGERVAVNLHGLSRQVLGRGQALVVASQWEETRVVDASLQVLASFPDALSRRGNHQLHVGTAHQQVSLTVLGGERVEPGGSGFVRLRLASPLPLVAGDRYVLRDGGRGETVGGGEVLDVAPVLPARRARPDRSLERVVAEHGWIEVERLARLTGLTRPADVGQWAVEPSLLAAVRRQLGEAVAAAGPYGLEAARLDPRERAVLADLPGVVLEQGSFRLAGEAQELASHPLVVTARARLFDPPAPAERGTRPAEVRELVRQRLLVDCGGIFFAPEALARARRELADLLEANPVGVTVSQLRQALGASRRVTLALLGRFDESGVTRRQGDLRVAGPRLTAPLEAGSAS